MVLSAGTELYSNIHRSHTLTLILKIKQSYLCLSPSLRWLSPKSTSACRKPWLTLPWKDPGQHTRTWVWRWRTALQLRMSPFLLHTELALWNVGLKFTFQKYLNAGAKICSFYISYLLRREGAKSWPFVIWVSSREGLQSPRLALPFVCSLNKDLLSSSSRQELTTCLPLALQFTLGSLFQ